ncbi:AAA family ATPase [Halorussus gelatinilyticus]|uniref:AAA family ATPase n=1 Tax=Halorussus gelatinilyticus TaxID=2937524 RepID=A0A8U0IJR5_9EURY|nr:AAA family ATPase [Halorussus gelatinilyticus]UPW00309.1 AAA family ATPase [Halorussus gelatinilyticus]
MNLEERIARRQATRDDDLLVDRRPLNPAVHLAEPVGRGTVLERLLDVFDPVFDRRLPPDAAVYGPKGAGKSALVSALFARLNDQFGRREGRLGTTTRAGTATDTVEFVHVDGYRAESEFQFLHRLLDALVDESVPRRGIGTERLREQFVERFASPTRSAVVAVDHAASENSPSGSQLREWFAPVADDVALVVVGRSVPDDWDAPTVHVPAYRQHALVDILTERASRALSSNALRHGQARRVAEWASGDAHDALAAVASAAELADADGADRIRASDVDAGIEDVRDGGVHLGRVFALPENRRKVLSELLALDPTPPIDDAASAIADRSDLSAGTVKRFLYELAERGVLERVETDATDGSGRRPSRPEPQFPTLPFRHFDGDARPE